MAYSVIATPVSGTTISTTAFGIPVKDNFDAAFPLGVDGWTSFTPTLTQSATVTKTVSYAKYQRVGRLITAQVMLAVTGAGTITNNILVGLPVTAAFSGAHYVVGTAWVFDASAPLLSVGVARAISTTTVDLFQTNNTGIGIGQAPNFALASGDFVAYSLTYEAAS